MSNLRTGAKWSAVAAVLLLSPVLAFLMVIAVEALIDSDYPSVQGFVLAMALVYILLNLSIDILYGVIDPRAAVSA